MFELSAEKFAKLMQTDVKGLKAFVKKNGKPSELRLQSATQVIRDLYLLLYWSFSNFHSIA